MVNALLILPSVKKPKAKCVKGWVIGRYEKRGIYIVDMMWREWIVVWARKSVMEASQAGQHPRQDMQRVSRADGMSRPVRGRAMRLVRRKCCGNVLKYI